jgi:hypothetical protein
LPRILLISLFFLLAACGSKHEAVRHCVDETGAVAADTNCSASPTDSKHHYAWVYSPSDGSNGK